VKALLNELRRTKSVRAVVLIVVGWILSPLTFWNDALVNIPIAYVCASAVALFGQQLFLPALIVSYWMTNLVGLVMMGKGIDRLISRERSGRHPVIVSLATTLVYTLVVVGLFFCGIIKPIEFSSLSRFFQH